MVLETGVYQALHRLHPQESAAASIQFGYRFPVF